VLGLVYVRNSGASSSRVNNAAERPYSAWAAVAQAGSIPDAGDLVASLLNFLGLAMFSQNDSREDTSKVVPVAWRRGMETNLKAKAEKYETKAAQCEEWAREATEGPERSLYGELADYYGKLATDFRRVIARRSLT
jgi:hypothetical protein